MKIHPPNRAGLHLQLSLSRVFGTAALLALTLAAVADCMAASSRPTNFLLITADNLVYGDLGCFGNREVRTPNLDTLAREGVRCTACAMVDQPIAALVRDLKQRGLLEDTLVVCGSEFGRTALGENRPSFSNVIGRDHHPNAFSIWLAGGGIKGGQVVGETDDVAWNVTKDPVHVHDLHATILHLFGFDHTKLTYRFQGRDFRLTDVAGHVVEKLFV